MYVNKKYEFIHFYGSEQKGDVKRYERIQLENAVLCGRDADEFCSWAKGVKVQDADRPAIVVARGGYQVGQDGREWREAATYSPEGGWLPATYAEALAAMSV